MGAFVGNVTSPFLQRRRGRVGKDIIVTLTPPTYAGAALTNIGANFGTVVCGLVGTDNTYQKTDDFGATAWIGKTFAAGTQRIGNSGLSSNVITFRPWNERMQLDMMALQCRFNAAGIVSGTGGALHEIDYNGNFNKTNFTVAGFPVESIAWSHDGQCFLAAGAASAGVVQGRGNLTLSGPDAPQNVNWNIPVGPWVVAVYAILEPVDKNRWAFITAVSGGNALKKVFRRKDQAPFWSTSADITNPVAGSALGNFVQIRGCIMGFDRVNSNVARSIDYGDTFASVAVGGGGPVHGSFRYGNRVYAVCRDAPRIRFSRNLGITWTTSPVQPSHAGVQLTGAVTRQFFGDVYLVGNDGAANRFYKYRPYMDI